ncbi:ArsR/SmtB family transcription factor [Herbiconiux daphne]|uniref:Helix-turn-helix domain-containing protein n=1 Tax=Herbiconiux daphne TaxID=2970914 RepID=A0ABT2H1K0_9MICO|nr:helix-turn-helix domain-containing protein [Herbiconiux daphne]MCS5733823.1 helix-turn-helix domain-containing protein [Herbiconiux daphne]
MGDVFKALADETRRIILDELVERDEQTLFEICTRLISKHGLTSSRQAVSQHLDILEDAGLVRVQRRGRYKLHFVDTAPLAQIARRWPAPAPPSPTPPPALPIPALPPPALPPKEK